MFCMGMNCGQGGTLYRSCNPGGYEFDSPWVHYGVFKHTTVQVTRLPL
jgi:hypothetical protein